MTEDKLEQEDLVRLIEVGYTTPHSPERQHYCRI